MTDNHDGTALAAVITSWGAWLMSLIVQALPLFQALSLIAATVASICAARYYLKRGRE